MKRLESSDDIHDVMERIVGRGIVVDPATSLCLSESERLRQGRWVVDCRSYCSPLREWRKAS